jgi:tetratricopeptide (TPR) repeat protein
VVPTTLQDLQAVLDNDNFAMNINTEALGEVGADNYYLATASWQVSSNTERNAYTWSQVIFAGETGTDWAASYKQVFYANIALDGLAKVDITNANQADWNNCRGSALFYRAFAFYQLACHYANPWTAAAASSIPGIPLTLTSDVNQPIVRASLADTYTKIVTDLVEAESLLPQNALYKTRPSKTVVNALLARVYLSMEDYDKALAASDKSLQGYNTLLDYNTLSATASFPFTRLNAEVIFHTTLANLGVFISSRLIVDTLLYASYSNNDLRKSLFFALKGTNMYSFKGSYYGAANPLFGGIGTDEVWLTRAECNARKGNTAAALSDLNTLLIKRWKTGTFVPVTAVNADDALAKILAERRKELLLRGTRWEDLRRLNKDPRFAVSLTRNVNGQTFTLAPNDPKYTYPIPDEVIAYHPDMQQNPR